LHTVKLPGKPDLILPKYKVVIFIHGCFWHAHENCKYYRLPKSNTEYWAKKIERNVSRDWKNQESLRDLGWKVIVVWECELKREADKRCFKLMHEIKGNVANTSYDT
jgi:DNA mismatch endonuclease (patch repair protein)